MNKSTKIIVIVLLVIAVAGMIIWKNKDNQVSESNVNEEILSENTLALVSGKEISKEYLEESFQALPPQYKEMFATQKDEYLNQLILRELLHQESIKRGYSYSEDEDIDQALAKLYTDVVGEPQVSQTEIEDFYNQNKEQMPGISLADVEEDSRNYLKQQKQTEIFEQYMTVLRENGDVILNQAWIDEQIALRPETPLDAMLLNGLPTVLDLGSDSCIPCKMMKPIFAELEEELAEKVNILILNVSEYSSLADKYNVRVIPTQIFFDAEGKQYWRHEGFLAKEDIIKKLEEIGASL